VTLTSGTVLVVDLKTGKLRHRNGEVSYWNGYPVQIAIYAGSTGYDPDTDTRYDLPYKVDQNWAIIAHLDVLAALQGEAVGSLILVDLEIGRRGADLAQAAKEGVHSGGGYPLQFGTISVSDGISMGHEGMHFSLVSREVIADSVETVMQAERLDGSVLLAGCDKSIPGMLMAAARLDLASVFLYAGSIAPGWVKLSDGTEKEITIIDSFEAVGAVQAGTMSLEDAKRIECAFAPGEGTCGGMYTANTMASVAEALGMSLPGSASPASADRRRDYFAHRSGEAVVGMLRRGQTARDILTMEAFENAIAVGMALGGSTNIVLHLLAIANEAEVPLTLADFNRIGDKVPHIADVKPFGRFVMNDVDRHGGLPVLMKALLDAGLLHGDALTVTGKTMAENLAELDPGPLDGTVLRSLDNPFHATGGITVLHGSLAPEGAVVKTAGFDTAVFEGPARVFERERAAMDALA
jgi:dihydroxy-acid dehydratase